jgi:hypothetical protein
MLKPKPGLVNEEIQVALRHVKELQSIIPGLLEVNMGSNLVNPAILMASSCGSVMRHI